MTDADLSREELLAQVSSLRKRADELDARDLELEREVVRRGVKLSCANVALARAKIAFDEISQQREEAVQDIAHDLKTPLTSIRGASQNILDGICGPINADLEEYMEIIRDQSDRLVGNVNWLVEAIRASNEVRALKTSDTAMHSLARRVVAALKPIADEKGVELCLATVEEVTLLVDATKMSHVLENLIGNALKFTEPGGKVTVSVEDEITHLVLYVKDTGVGMSPEQQEGIFRRYYRATDTTGSGLGLLIVKDIVRLHRAELSVQSERDKGTTFAVHLPRN